MNPSAALDGKILVPLIAFHGLPRPVDYIFVKSADSLAASDHLQRPYKLGAAFAPESVRAPRLCRHQQFHEHVLTTLFPADNVTLG